MENTNDPTNPMDRESVTDLATRLLAEQGYRPDFKTAEFVNPTTGVRGRLAVFPVFEDGKDTGLVKAVKLVLPGRKPTFEEVMNRVATVAPMITVWEA